MKIFNIHLEFDSKVLQKTIEKFIADKQKAYVCVVDGSVLSNAHYHLDYRNIVNNAAVNTCDGSSIAMMANMIYGSNYRAYSGPVIFEHYIERPYKHLLLGNTIEKVNQIKEKVKSKGLTVDLSHLDVPFVSVEEFDYKSIAEKINKIQPDIIWVSLGNPKQEIFMSRILPYINSGVMFGIGAAFNFYIGELKNRKVQFGALGVNWIDRVAREPKKQFRRMCIYLKTMPILFYEELKKNKENR